MAELSRPLIKLFRFQLLAWGCENPQSFPWRYQSDPYLILVSEFMLHRTQTRQVIPVYKKFIEKYPDLNSNINANPVELRKDLKSLGLVWRIEGMISALNEISDKYGIVPVDYEKLISIRCIGQYIAGATICFSNNIAITLVDTNIVRVIGRFFGLDLKGEARRRKSIIHAIDAIVDPDQPRDFYYALIDLAHLICKSRKPTCEICPLSETPCEYKQVSLGRCSMI